MGQNEVKESGRCRAAAPLQAIGSFCMLVLKELPATNTECSRDRNAHVNQSISSAEWNPNQQSSSPVFPENSF